MTANIRGELKPSGFAKISTSPIDHGVYSGYYAISAVDHSAAITAMRQVKPEQSPP